MAVFQEFSGTGHFGIQSHQESLIPRKTDGKSEPLGRAISRSCAKSL
jgi:hypothetical protein